MTAQTPATAAGQALDKWTAAAFPGTPSAKIRTGILTIEAQAAAAERAAIRAAVLELRVQIPEERVVDAELEAARDTLDQVLALLDAREPSHG